MAEAGELDLESRLLTEEEQAQAKEDRAEKPIRNELAAKGERVFIDLLQTRLFQAVNVRKAPTRLQNIYEKGKVVGQFRESVDVDILADRVPLMVNGEIIWPALRVEVKSTSTSSWALNKLSDAEKSYLDDAVAGNMAAWLALVWFDQTLTCKHCGESFPAKRQKKDVLCLYCKEKTSARRTHLDAHLIHVFPWRRWKTHVLPLLQSKIKGNYKGKSIRKQEWPDLEGYAISKVKSRWVISESHWLRPLLPFLHGIVAEHQQESLPI